MVECQTIMDTHRKSSFLQDKKISLEKFELSECALSVSVIVVVVVVVKVAAAIEQ